MSLYRDALRDAMTELGRAPETVVVGYNTSKAGGHGGGSFAGFPEDRIIEMPLGENLMVGVAIGLALDGKIPLIWFERMDFILLALDALFNHLSRISELSEGLHKPACIIRCVVGNSQTPLFTGATHCQDYTGALQRMSTSIRCHRVGGLSEGFLPTDLATAAERERIGDAAAPLIGRDYAFALQEAREGRSSILVEMKDLMS